MSGPAAVGGRGERCAAVDGESGQQCRRLEGHTGQHRHRLNGMTITWPDAPGASSEAEVRTEARPGQERMATIHEVAEHVRHVLADTDEAEGAIEGMVMHITSLADACPGDAEGGPHCEHWREDGYCCTCELWAPGMCLKVCGQGLDEHDESACTQAEVARLHQLGEVHHANALEMERQRDHAQRRAAALERDVERYRAEVARWIEASGLTDTDSNVAVTPAELQRHLSRLTLAAEAALEAMEDPNTAWTVAGTEERQALRRALGRDVRAECDGCGVDLPAVEHSPGCKTGGAR